MRFDNLEHYFITHPLLHILQKEKIATKIAAKIAHVNRPLERIKAHLHGRFLLRFQLRFSPFGGCEGVDKL